MLPTYLSIIADHESAKLGLPVGPTGNRMLTKTPCTIAKTASKGSKGSFSEPVYTTYFMEIKLKRARIKNIYRVRLHTADWCDSVLVLCIAVQPATSTLYEYNSALSATNNNSERSVVACAAMPCH